MTRDEAAHAIGDALDAILTAYWAACDTAECAVDPDDLNAPAGLLDDAYDIALTVESIAAERGLSWADGRGVFREILGATLP